MKKPDIELLRTEFTKVFGINPPRQASPEFLSGNLTYHQQCRQHGGLNPKLQRQLLAVAQDVSVRPKPSAATWVLALPANFVSNTCSAPLIWLLENSVEKSP